MFPTVAELEAQIETRNYRRGAGNLFVNSRGNVKKLEPMPKKPTLQDSSGCVSRRPTTCCRARRAP